MLYKCFEYKMIECDTKEEMLKQLNTFGVSGWRLVEKEVIQPIANPLATKFTIRLLLEKERI